ncbi:BspA family leucine-rich repeat surface protein, partial [Helicobacter rappini]
MSYKNRIESILKELNQGVYEKDEALKLILLSFLSGKSAFLYGPPGTAKSLVARRVALAFDMSDSKKADSKKDSASGSHSLDCSYFRAVTTDKVAPTLKYEQNKQSTTTNPRIRDEEKQTQKADSNTFFAYLMNRFSTPEEIFGPIDIAELKQNRLTRSTQGYLPTAHFAFLDEIWKSSPAILNTLLTIINEKIYRDGNMDIKVPLKGLVCASNEFPTPNQGLEALYDRLIIRLKVLSVEKKASFEALLKGIDEAKPTITKPFNLQELQDITQKAKSITFSTQSLKALHHLKSLIETHNKALDKDTTDLDFSLVSTQESEKIYISDRRWVAMAELLRVAAVLSDRDEVLPIDIMLLKHCLWSSESHIDIIQDILAKALENTIHINLDEFDISHLQDEYEVQYELVKTEFYSRNKAKKVSQKKKDEYTNACDTLLESIMSLQERLAQIYNTQKSSLYNVFLNDTDYDIALQDIAEKQTQLERLYLALDQLKHIIARQIEPMPLKYMDKSRIIYHPKTKDELLNLIDDKSVYLGDIDTSAITDMSGLFRDSNRTDFSGIEYWDVSSVVNMRCMFYGAKKFDQPLDFWNVSNVKDMRSMFTGATSFNQPLDSWDVSSVTDMYCMFHNARKFNQPLNSWNVSSVEDMSNMFYGAKKFDQPLDFWNVRNVKDMSYMFCGASSFNQPLDSWNVRNATKMQYMFKG